MNHRDDYRKMVVALLDAKTDVLSLLRQLNLEVKIPKEQFQAIVRQCALDIVAKNVHIGRKPRGPNRRRVR
jgi:hypothetical protein